MLTAHTVKPEIAPAAATSTHRTWSHSPPRMDLNILNRMSLIRAKRERGRYETKAKVESGRMPTMIQSEWRKQGRWRRKARAEERRQPIGARRVEPRCCLNRIERGFDHKKQVIMILSPSPSVGRSLQSTSPVQNTPEETCLRNYPTKSVSGILSKLSGVRLFLRERSLDAKLCKCRLPLAFTSTRSTFKT